MHLKPFVLRFQLRYHHHRLVLDIRLHHRIPFFHPRDRDGDDVHDCGCGRDHGHGRDGDVRDCGRVRDDGDGDAHDRHLQ